MKIGYLYMVDKAARMIGCGDYAAHAQVPLWVVNGVSGGKMSCTFSRE